MYFENIYNQHFKSNLDILETRRKSILIYIFASRIFQIAALSLFFSMFFGFLRMFMHNTSNHDSFFHIFKWFFYMVAGIILLVIIRKMILGLLKLLQPQNTPDRKHIFILSLLVTIGVIIGAGMVGFYILGSKIGLLLFVKWLGSIVLIAVFAFLSVLLAKPEKKFIQQYKNIVIQKSIAILNNSVKYFPERFLLKEQYLKCRLFNTENIYTFTGKNLITGNYENGNFSFSELEVITRHEQRSNGKTETTYNTVFNGILYESDFNKNFKGYTCIKPDYLHKLLGSNAGERINELLTYRDAKIVNLEDILFEQEFAVYSTDQIEARYILTPAFMEKICRLKNAVKNPLHMSFSNNKMYVALPFEFDLLAPVLLRSINKPSHVEPIYNTLQILIHLATDLHLNIRL